MKQYTDLAKRILAEGHRHPDRTGVGRISLYGETLRFKMADGFPIDTTRKINYHAAFKEMLWFITGDTNTKNLDTHIWDQWAAKPEDIEVFVRNREAFFSENNTSIDVAIAGMTEAFNGSIGPLYGAAWRSAPVSITFPFLPDVTEDDFASDRLTALKNTYSKMDIIEDMSDEEKILDYQAYLNECYYGSVDQLHKLVTELKKNPYGSRHVMSTWIPSWLPDPNVPLHHNPMLMRGVLAPCHVLVQCHVIPPSTEHPTPRLILQMYQRSADFLVGSAFNIAQYSLLLHLLAKVTGYEPYEFIYNLGDVHIYSDQVYLAMLQLNREQLPLPQIELADDINDIFQVKIDQIQIKNYQHHDPISYPVAV